MKGTHKTTGGSDDLARIQALRLGYRTRRGVGAAHAVGTRVTAKVAGHIGEPSGDLAPAGSSPVSGDTGAGRIEVSKKKPHLAAVPRENLIAKKSHIAIVSHSGEEMRLVFDHFSTMETSSGKKGTVWKDSRTGVEYYWDYSISHNKVRLHEKVARNGYKPFPQEYLLIEFVV